MTTHIINEDNRSLTLTDAKDTIQLSIEDPYQEAYINLTNKEALKLANTIIEHLI